MLLSELIGQDIELVRCGSRYYRWKLHNSFVIDDVRGKWNFYKDNQWGDYYDWLKFYRNLPDREAYALAKSVETARAPLVEIPAEKIRRAQANLDNVVGYLLNQRAIGVSTAKKFRLGWVSGAVCIPNYSDSDELISVRYRLLRDRIAEDGRRIRYYSETGSRPWYPYGLWMIPRTGGDVLFLVEGELKTIVVSQMGFYALGTQGTEFRPGWTGYLAPWKRVIYLRDSRDLGGIRSANKLKKIYPRAEVCCMPAPYKAVDDYYLSDPKQCLEHISEIERSA